MHDALALASIGPQSEKLLSTSHMSTHVTLRGDMPLLSVSLCLSLSVCLSVCLSVSICLSLYLCLEICRCKSRRYCYYSIIVVYEVLISPLDIRLVKYKDLLAGDYALMQLIYVTYNMTHVCPLMYI
jgi:hypothetical protein